MKQRGQNNFTARDHRFLAKLNKNEQQSTSISQLKNYEHDRLESMAESSKIQNLVKKELGEEGTQEPPVSLPKKKPHIKRKLRAMALLEDPAAFEIYRTTLKKMLIPDTSPILLFDPVRHVPPVYSHAFRQTFDLGYSHPKESSTWIAHFPLASVHPELYYRCTSCEQATPSDQITQECEDVLVYFCAACRE